MRLPLATISLLLLLGTPLSAQEPGDSIRIRITPSAGWVTGRLVRLSQDSATVRQYVDDRVLGLRSVSRVEVWRRKSPGKTIALNMLIGAVTMGGLQAAFGDPIDGYSEGRSIAIYATAGASTGLVFGVIEMLLWPGKWKGVDR